MKKSIIFVYVFLLTLLVVAPKDALAKRLLPSAAKPATTKSVGATTSKGVNTSVKFRGDRRAVIVSFSNLSIASNVSYTLSYQTRGTTQGATGTINSASGDGASRELLFGTCSHGVCRYDSGITNAKFTVTTMLKTGKKVIKSFRLKV